MIYIYLINKLLSYKTKKSPERERNLFVLINKGKIVRRNDNDKYIDKTANA